MLKYLSRLDCIFPVLVCLIFVCHVSSGWSGKGGFVNKSESVKPVYNGLGYANGDPRMRQVSVASPRESSSRARQGIGLSAWGIIGVLAGSLLFGTGLYYALLFYPILCKKERKNCNDKRLDCCPSAPPAIFNSPPPISTTV